MAVRVMGEFRDRQMLYTGQSPEVLETLRRAAIVKAPGLEPYRRYYRYARPV